MTKVTDFVTRVEKEYSPGSENEKGVYTYLFIYFVDEGGAVVVSFCLSNKSIVSISQSHFNRDLFCFLVFSNTYYINNCKNL